MEFINPYKRYSEDVKQFCHFEDAEALNNEFSSTELSNWVHTSDNSFIDTSFGRTCKQLHESHYQLIGISYEAPWAHNGYYCAVVFTDGEDYLWCHTSEIIINWWKEQIQDV